MKTYRVVRAHNSSNACTHGLRKRPQIHLMQSSVVDICRDSIMRPTISTETLLFITNVMFDSSLGSSILNSLSPASAPPC